MSDSTSMNPGLSSVHGIFCALNGLGFLIVFIMGVSSAPAYDVVAGLVALSLVPAAVGVAHFYAMNGAESGKSYGRTISRIIGVFWLIGFPIGTILGIYVLIKTGDKHWRSAQSTQAATAVT